MLFYCSSLLHELGISHPFGMPGKRWRCRVVRQLLACAGGCRVWHRRLADWRREKEGFFLQAYWRSVKILIYMHIFLGSLHLKTTTVFISGIANGSLLLPVVNGANFMTSAGWKTVMTGTGLTLFVCSMWRLPFCTTKRDVNFRSLKGNLIPTRRRFGIQGELTSSFCSRSEGETVPQMAIGGSTAKRETSYHSTRILPCEASMSQLEPQIFRPDLLVFANSKMPWVKSWTSPRNCGSKYKK